MPVGAFGRIRRKDVNFHRISDCVAPYVHPGLGRVAFLAYGAAARISRRREASHCSRSASAYLTLLGVR